MKDIQPFLDSYRGQINIDEIAQPLNTFKTFNEFFYRKLKPGARPVAHPNEPTVVTSAADCRLQVYLNVDEATRFWVKGRHFSIAGLLAVEGEGDKAGDSSSSDDDDDVDKTEVESSSPEPSIRAGKAQENGYESGDSTKSGSMQSASSNVCRGGTNSFDASQFYGGCMAIFRLAPQDYHRFHSPIDGTIVSITDVAGGLLTVNPIAVNSTFCDVFNQNKRSVMLIQSEVSWSFILTHLLF